MVGPGPDPGAPPVENEGSGPTGGGLDAGGEPARAGVAGRASRTEPSPGAGPTGCRAGASADLSGKTALVTGGTSGIGRAVALELADRGADVVVVGRSGAKGRAVSDAAEARGAPGAVGFIGADLSRTAEVRRVAERFLASHERLDVLVHSAGGHFLRRGLTPDGIEVNFATNYLSKFLLTNLLLERLKGSAPARIVVVGSPVVNPERFMGLDAVRGERPVFPLRAMLTSGLATAVWTAELARRLEGTGVTANNVNPVVVRGTDIGRSWPAPLRALDRVNQRLFGVPVEEGARAPVWLATSGEVSGVSGRFFRRTEPARVPAGTFDRGLGERLWALSERLTGAVPPVRLPGSVPAPGAGPEGRDRGR